MANQITTDSVRAFAEGRKFARGNMQVVSQEDGMVYLYQHGNCIAGYDRHNQNATLTISNCGWYSVTTKQRLDEVLRVMTFGTWRLGSDKGQWVLLPRDHGQSINFTGKHTLAQLASIDKEVADDKAARHKRFVEAAEALQQEDKAA